MNRPDSAKKNLDKAIYLAGSPAQLAHDLGTSRQYVYIWQNVRYPADWQERVADYVQSKLAERKAELEAIS